MDNRPIGVFDSGLGGLTGVRELRKRLPHEEIIYFGDTGRVPYGSRSPETILQYARQDVAFLLSKNVKCIMAACGTVSSTYPAAEAAKLPVPYLGVVDAAAREAAFATRNRRIGVIGTAATIRSRSYEKLLRQLAERDYAVIYMTEALAQQLAADGITVNNVAPGVIFTDRNVEALSDPTYAAEVTASIPAGFYGEPRDCTGVVRLLLSDAARYITGQSIYVDGGKSL